MYLVLMVAIGLIVAVGARLFLPRRNPISIVSTVLLGVAGSVLAGFIGVTFGWFEGAWEVSGFIASVVGAMLAILLYRDMPRLRGR